MYTKKKLHKKKKYTLKSYSPNVNKQLINNSIRSYDKNIINDYTYCNDILEIKIDDKCYKFNNEFVQKKLLQNLKYSKKMDPSKFIAPKQVMSNCWFNTMFVTFFFSDKGIKFFRFFRELMITGKKIDNTKINRKLYKIFFIFNLFIESSYNQNNNIKIFNNYTNNLNTNFFIKEIYNHINNKNNKTNVNLLYTIPNIHDAHNPLYYYISIINYLKYDILKILPIDISNKYNKNQIYSFLQKYLDNYKTIPEIIVLEDLNSKTHHNIDYEFILNNTAIKYRLDSIIITNKDFYNKDSNKHFTSLLTCNGMYYKFDGYSYSRLSKFNWINYVKYNINKDWTFNENKKYIPEKYNITMGYKMLYYYRI